MTTDERIRIYTEYLKMKVFEKDWHGVQDAASDLRELEVLRISESLIGKKEKLCK